MDGYHLKLYGENSRFFNNYFEQSFIVEQCQQRHVISGEAWAQLLLQQYPLQLGTEQNAQNFASQLLDHQVLVPVPYHYSKVEAWDVEYTYQFWRYYVEDATKADVEAAMSQQTQADPARCMNILATIEQNVRQLYDVAPSPEQTHLILYRFDRLLHQLLNKYVDANLKFIVHAKMFSDVIFLQLIEHATMLRYVAVELLDNEERTVLFLNVLNFMMLHQKYLYRNEFGVVLPIRTECYFVGKYMLSMDDILFNILCKQNDPWKDYLQAYQVQLADIRVHFCISTGEDYRILPRCFAREFLNYDMNAAVEHFVALDTQFGDVSQSCNVTVASMYHSIGLSKYGIIQLLLHYLPSGKGRNILDSWNKTNPSSIQLMYRAKDRVDNFERRRKSIKYVKQLQWLLICKAPQCW